MPRTSLLAGALSTVAALALAASASAAPIRIAEDDTVPLVSGNVTPLTTIPVPTPIGARFRDNHMFVTGTAGLTVYDISKPESPTPVGALPLPHFENEDVDLGGDLLLISNDPSEGVGALYVIDISDPTLPKLAGPPMANDFIEVGLSELGLDEPQPAGIGHTISCVKPDCSYAWMAGTSRGIDVVDLRDPAAPKKVARFRPDVTGLASHDVQVDGTGLAWVVGADGTAAYDVADPVHPKLVARTDESLKNSGQLGLPGPDPVFGFGGDGQNPIDLIHHNSLRLGDLAEDPVVTGPVSEPPASAPVSDAGTVIAPGSSEPQPAPAPAPRPAAKRKPKKTKKPVHCRTRRQKRTKACRRIAARKRKAAEKRAHTDVARARAATPRATGFRLKPFAQQKGRTYPAGGDSPLFGITEEDYTRPTCKGAGSFQTWGMTGDRTSTGAAKLVMLGMYQTELEALVNGRGWAPVTGLCSAHYFDYRDGIVAQGWYEEGTRFLDVRDPTHIRQVGYWVPAKGETWSVVYPPTDPTGTIVYALDFTRGIDVLKLDRNDLAPRQAPVRRSWLTGAHGPRDGASARTGLTQRSRYGYVCRLAARVAASL